MVSEADRGQLQGGYSTTMPHTVASRPHDTGSAEGITNRWLAADRIPTSDLVEG